MADLRSKTCAYLRDGAVRVLVSRTVKTENRPYHVAAVVKGHTARRVVDLTDGRWSCTCKAVIDDGQPCAHVAAVQLVTGWPSAAAKTTAGRAS